MEKSFIGLDTNRVPLVTVDGIAEFTERAGSFHREYLKDADPLLEWGECMRAWINELRASFGACLCHVAVMSKYTEGQFKDSAWKKEEIHPLNALCVDETYRRLTVDDSGLAEMVDKRENDATSSQKFMDIARSVPGIVLTGVTGTTCIQMTVRSLIRDMEGGNTQLGFIVIPEEGIASRKSRQNDHDVFVNAWKAKEEKRVIVVPMLRDVRWVNSLKT